MPRVSRKQTERNRVRITETAIRLFKERGFRAISLSEIMGSSGLTMGGFYGHFESKEALANEACALAFEEAARIWGETVRAQPEKKEARRLIITDYLSTERRDRSNDICPTAAFTAEVSQDESNPKIRETYINGLESLVAAFGATMVKEDEAASKSAALVEYSLMVGALMLARAAGKSSLSDEILAAVRSHLLD